ncbi:MAG: glycosyltransferase [Pirellulales bacterium]|nr:glycosyltransferase [Pirellulales bacterium]
MRIGIDMFGEQSPSSRKRGIGRYVLNFVSALLRRDRQNEYVLYYYDGFEHTELEQADRARIVTLDSDPGGGSLCVVPQRVVDANPQQLDLFLVLSPMESYRGWKLPQRPVNSLSLGVLCHDLIPGLFPDKYLPHADARAVFHHAMNRLRQYDLVLTNSTTTKLDCEAVLDIDPRRAVAIDAGCDHRFWQPDRHHPMPEEQRALLASLGIDRPYIFNLSGVDWRKNLHGLIDAFGLLPARLRERHQLVLTMHMRAEDVASTRAYAAQRGVDRQLVLTNFQPDEVIRTLYQRSEAFVFPSHYEGFGFPIVEAMLCGAAVVAGNNSSQVEVVGDAGLLCDTWDAADIAAKVTMVLDDRSLQQRLRQQGPAFARQFTWERTADLAIDAFRAHESRRRAAHAFSHRSKRRVAVFAALPPQNSPAAVYAADWLMALAEHYAIDVFHDSDCLPMLSLACGEFACHDYRLFRRLASLANYDAVIHHLADDGLHEFAYESLLRYGGIAVLHDFNLAGSAAGTADRLGALSKGLFPHLAQQQSLAASLPKGDARNRHSALRLASSEQGWFFNRPVFDQADKVVLPDAWQLARAQGAYPHLADRMAVIPSGYEPPASNAARRGELRARYALAADAFVVLAFSDRSEACLTNERAEAFAALVAHNPRSVLFLMGHAGENPAVRRKFAGLGLEDRVHQIASPAAATWRELIDLADLALHVQRPPIEGEAMTTLLWLLGAGIPTIVNDVEGFASLPEGVVCKVRFDALFAKNFRDAVVDLAGDAQRRAALVQAARAHVARFHHWQYVSGKFQELIDRTIGTTARTPARLMSGVSMRLQAAA